MTKIIRSALLIAFLATAAVFGQAQSVLEISRVDTSRSHLSCSSGVTEAVLTVQVYFVESDARLKDHTVSVGISIFSARPPENSLRIVEAEREVTLTRSPGLAEFHVQCNSSTVPGEVIFAATIENPPEGIDLTKQMGTENSRVTIKVDAASR